MSENNKLKNLSQCSFYISSNIRSSNCLSVIFLVNSNTDIVFPKKGATNDFVIDKVELDPIILILEVHISLKSISPSTNLMTAG